MMTLLNLSYPVSWVARLKETLDPNNFTLFSKISKNDDVFLTFFWIGLFSFFEIVTNGHGKSVDLFFFRYIGIGVDLKEKKIFNPILCHWSLSIPPVFRGYGEIPVAWSGSLKAAVSRLYMAKMFSKFLSFDAYLFVPYLINPEKSWSILLSRQFVIESHNNGLIKPSKYLLSYFEVVWRKFRTRFADGGNVLWDSGTWSMKYWNIQYTRRGVTMTLAGKFVAEFWNKR